MADLIASALVVVVAFGGTFWFGYRYAERRARLARAARIAANRPRNFWMRDGHVRVLANGHVEFEMGWHGGNWKLATADELDALIALGEAAHHAKARSLWSRP